jgi:uncharacterized membrane protein YkoI
MRLRSLLLGLALAAALAGPAVAQSDQQRAREAMQAGRIRPLQDILLQVSRQVAGRVLNAWLEEGEAGAWIYRLKLLDTRGNIVGVVVDARNGQILQVFGPKH